MSSSWGRVTSTKHIGRGIKQVHCEGHGGILVSEDAMQTQPCLQKLKDYPLLDTFRSDQGGYEFEEDCDASIIYYALGKDIVKQIWNISDEHIEQHHNATMRSIIMWNPNVYTHMSGVGVSIFESYKLREQHYLECGNKVHMLCFQYRPSDYEIPEGYRIFSVYEVNMPLETRCFKVSTKDFESINQRRNFPIEIDGLEEVEEPKSLRKTANI